MAKRLSRLDSLPAHVRRQMKAWNVPAVGLGIVRDDKVILAEGFGLADVRRGVEATADTPFAICSCSKAFTCAVLAMLVEEGKLAWETPVREYLPDFRLQDAFASERITPLDLVTHRSGLPRHDGVWFGSTADRATMVRRLRYLEPTADLRARYQYQNIMYAAAGWLAEQVTGTSWEEHVQTRILDPLGMTSTTTGIAGMRSSSIAARAHFSGGKQPTRIAYRDLDAIGPAGSINSTVNDMLRWVRVHLSGGKVDGKRIVSERTLRQLHKPRIPVDGEPFDEFQLPSYALGWTTFIYRGHRVVTHSGGIDGFRCRTTALPDDGIGVVCLTNGTTALPHHLTWETLDRVLGLEPRPWARRFRKLADDEEKAATDRRRKALRERAKRTKPSHALKDYAGTYVHPGYGTAVIELRKGRLHLVAKGNDARLKHWHYESFEVRAPREQPMLVRFVTDNAGRITHLAVPAQEGVDDILFERQKD